LVHYLSCQTVRRTAYLNFFYDRMFKGLGLGAPIYGLGFGLGLEGAALGLGLEG